MVYTKSFLVLLLSYRNKPLIINDVQIALYTLRYMYIDTKKLLLRFLTGVLANTQDDKHRSSSTHKRTNNTANSSSFR